MCKKSNFALVPIDSWDKSSIYKSWLTLQKETRFGLWDNFLLHLLGRASLSSASEANSGYKKVGEKLLL